MRFPVMNGVVVSRGGVISINDKTQNGRFPSEIALLSKKVCYKIYLCERRQRHSLA